MLEPNLILSHMNKLDFFNDFTHAEKIKITHGDSFLIRCLAKTVVIKEGAKDNAIFILISGEAQVTKNEAPDTIIASLKPGDVFGEISFITRKPRATNVTTRTKAIILKLTPESWRVLGSDITRKFYSQLLRILIERISGLNDTIIKLKKEVEGCVSPDQPFIEEFSTALEIEATLREKLESIRNNMGVVIRE